MNILIIADSHSAYQTTGLQPDVVFLLGDIDYYEVRKIDKEFECPKFGVLGNHDGFDYFDNTSIVNVHKNIIDFHGFKIGGFEGCPRYNNRKYLQYTEEEAESYLKEMEKVDIFLAHSNPKTEINFDVSDAHRGFISFTKYIEKHQPTYFLHGHIHQKSNYYIGETNVICVYPDLQMTI